MANDAYLKTLRKIMTAPIPAKQTSRSRAEIEADISAVTTQLAGPLPNIMRFDLVEAKRHLRAELEAAAP